MKIHRNRESGFTLVELLIVVIILGILAAITIPMFNNVTSETREATLAADLKNMRQVISLYRVQHNDAYPDSSIATKLTIQTDVSGAAGTKYGPYLRVIPANPVNGLDTITTSATMPGAATDASGWLYATGTGEIRANSTGAGPSGANYYDL